MNDFDTSQETEDIAFQQRGEVKSKQIRLGTNKTAVPHQTLDTAFDDEGSSSERMDDQAPSRLVADNRTFFCSELVAKAFKILGVIENDTTSCTQFYPKHFSTEGQSFLKLTEGTDIGQEHEVRVDGGAILTGKVSG